MTKLNYEKQTTIERGRAGVILDRTEFARLDLPKTWLRVPYSEKDIVKALGGRWDAIEKKWYCLGKTGKFKKWLRH